MSAGIPGGSPSSTLGACSWLRSRSLSFSQLALTDSAVGADPTVRMPPPHLRFHLPREIFRPELPPLFGQDNLERYMEQEVSQLHPDRIGVVLTQSVVEFEHLLHEIGAQSLGSLGPVPRAPRAQVADQVHDASNR
jgi:hypothetical protein